MPEEINRILTDYASDILFCPIQQSVDNLNNELLITCTSLEMWCTTRSFISHKWPPQKLTYGVHHDDNTDNHDKLKSIFYALKKISQDLLPVIIPMHPRTKKKIELMKNLLLNLGFQQLPDFIRIISVWLLNMNHRYGQ